MVTGAVLKLIPMCLFTEDVLHKNKGNPRKRKTVVLESRFQPRREGRGIFKMAVKGVPTRRSAHTAGLESSWLGVEQGDRKFQKAVVMMNYLKCLTKLRVS